MALRPNQADVSEPALPQWDLLLKRQTPSLESVSLLHRDFIHSKRLLVTGAGGSIGSALAQALAQADPAELVLLDSAEAPLYEITQTLEASKPVAVLASVTDANALGETFSRYQPQIIFHAAALKHVPLMEANPFAVMATNALGTETIAATAAKHGCEELVMVSTDKAADPLSLMGASKRIAELLLFTSHTKMRTRSVRLGNVLGSSGSVVPLFLNQIAHGGPVTVTHSEARRYFMTIAETVDALLAAISPTCPGGILAADPGPSIRILNLAKYLIAQSGRPETQIIFTALRPGDKLEESLISSRESFVEDRHTQLRAVQSHAPEPAALESAMRHLQESIEQRDLPHLLEVTQHLVPEYKPSQLLRDQLATATVTA